MAFQIRRAGISSFLLATTALAVAAASPLTVTAAQAGDPIRLAQAAPQDANKKKGGPPQRQGQPAAQQQQQKKQQPQQQRPAPTARPAQPQQQQQRPAAAPQRPPQAPQRPVVQQSPQQQQQQLQRKQPPQQQQQRPVAQPPQQQLQPPQQQQRVAPGVAPSQQQRQQRVAPGTPQQQQQVTPQRQQIPPVPQQQQPAARQAPAGAQTVNPLTAAPAPQTRDAREFLRRGGQGPGRRIDQVRQERQEIREGNRTIIREGDRAIVREGGRSFVRHNESSRFAVGARDVRVDRRGNDIETVVVRPNGSRIVTVTDADGRLLRRVRRDAGGRDVIIIDNSRAPRRPPGYFVQLPPPVIRIPRERYIVDAYRSRPEDIFAVFLAPPVEPIEEVYSLDDVRYSAPLRDRMPRVDLDVNFDTGSWELTPEEVDKLSVIADGILRAVERNPREVFMIEGYTDAVGDENDNLSLSDRRAEAVAVALTEQFNVPPENLVTQGYGEQYLKVPTDGPERANRRVAVRRITPLIDREVAAR